MNNKLWISKRILFHPQTIKTLKNNNENNTVVMELL